MKIFIQGKYMNGNVYSSVIPKDPLTLSEAEELLNSLDLSDNNSMDNGYPLDFSSMTASIYDDEVIKPVEITRLKIELSNRNLLSMVDSNISGEAKIWWDNVREVDFYSPVCQGVINEMSALGITMEMAKDIFRKAYKID